MPIMYYMSDGGRISEAGIKSRYSAAIREKYQYSTVWLCEGCGAPAMGSAHIIAKARLKILHKTELIWHPESFFPACSTCNMAIENPKGEAWKELWNLDRCLLFIEKHDPELFFKFAI
jgi:hypothetical protein